MYIDDALAFAFRHGLLRPERRHLDVSEPRHKCLPLALAAGVPACYETDIAPQRPHHVLALKEAYRHGALEPDLDAHLAGVTGFGVVHVMTGAYMGGLRFEERHLTLVEDEADRACLLARAYEHGGLRAVRTDDAVIAAFRQPRFRAVALAAAFRHGGLAPDYDLHIAPLVDDRDAAEVLAGAYDGGLLEPDFDRHVARIADLDVRGIAVCAALRRGLAPDFAKHVAPFSGHAYSEVLAAAYRAGLRPDFDAQIRDRGPLMRRALVLAAAYEAGLAPDFELHLLPCRRAWYWHDALAQAYRHGLAPSVAHVVAGDDDPSRVLCLLCDAGHVPDLDSELVRSLDTHERPSLLLHAFRAGLAADFQTHVATVDSEAARFAVLAAAYKHGGLSPHASHLATFSEPAIRELVHSLSE